MTHPADPLISAWLNDEIDAAGVRSLEQMLRTDASARDRFARFCQSEVILPQATQQAPMRPGTTAVRRAVPRPVRNLARSLPSRFPWMLPVALAALVAVVVVVTNGMRTTPSSAHAIAAGGPLRLEQAEGSVVVAGQEVSVGSTIARGAELSVRGGPARLRWQGDGSEVTLTPDTVVRVVAGDVALHLTQGDLEAHITARTSTPFTIATAHASTAVMGTRFVLHAGTDHTDVQVHEGRVRFQAVADATVQEVMAQEQASADVRGLRRSDGAAVLGLVPTARVVTQVLGPRMIGRGTLRLSELPADGFNLRVECDPAVKSVHINMRGVDERLEQVVHFHVFGDTENRGLRKWRPRTGTFPIDLQPFADAGGHQPLGPLVTFELTIMP